MTAKIPAAIFDRDGTTFSVAHHREGDQIRCWHCFNGLAAFDSPVPHVVSMMFAAKSAGMHILMTSGREDKVRQDFVSANQKAGLPIDKLFMRRTGDQRQDAAVKLEIYKNQIEPYYDVQLVVDDRNSVCDMWRSLGLHLVQVTDPGILPRLGG